MASIWLLTRLHSLFIVEGDRLNFLGNFEKQADRTKIRKRENKDKSPAVHNKRKRVHSHTFACTQSHTHSYRLYWSGILYLAFIFWMYYIQTIAVSTERYRPSILGHKTTPLGVNLADNTFRNMSFPLNSLSHWEVKLVWIRLCLEKIILNSAKEEPTITCDLALLNWSHGMTLPGVNGLIPTGVIRLMHEQIQYT